MAIISKEVEVLLNSSNIKYYESLGYEIPKYYNKNNSKYLVKRGTKIIVKIEHLQLGSNISIKIQCDGCEKKYNIGFNKYNDHVLENDKYYCKKCATKLFATIKIQKTYLENSISFENWCINNNRQDILDRWDYELNDCKPNDVNYCTKKKYYFKCLTYYNHKSELKKLSDLSILNRSFSCKQCNSFAQYLLDIYGENGIVDYWSDKNNKLNPWEVSRGSNSKKVWIKCENINHEDYDIYPNNFIKGERCNKCSQERTESFLQEKVRLHLENLDYNIQHEYNCSIIPINPKTKHKLPYDNEIVELKLIIEVHGVQHYEINTWHKKIAKRNNTTPEYELHMQQVRDRYKRIFAKWQGYFYLEIPYWTDNKEVIWKKLIDEKIKEINDNAKYTLFI